MKIIILSTLFFASFLFTSEADAAIAFDASSTVAFADGAASTTVATTSLTISAGLSNSIVIMGISNGLGSPSTTAMTATYAGQAMTLAGVVNNGTNNCTSRMFYLLSPPSGANIASSSWTNRQGVSMGVASFSGVDQTTPVEASSTATSSGGASTTVKVTLTTVSTNAWVMDNVCAGGVQGTSTAPQVTLWRNVLPGNNDPWAGSSYTTTTATSSITMEWKLSGTRQWSSIGLALKPATGVVNAVGSLFNKIVSRLKIIGGLILK